MQVGYDAQQFGDDIDAFVGKVAKNRHIGNSGFIIICDEQFNIVTEDNENFGKNFESIGIHLDLESMVAGEIFEVNLKSEPYLCAYHFVEGYYIIGAMPVEEAMFMETLSVYMNVFMEIVIFAALFVLIYFLIKKIIIDNIRKINATLAQQIQYSSLPVVFPNRCEFKLYAKMVTAKEVGGDFYDFYMLNDRTVAFLIAGVSRRMWITLSEMLLSSMTLRCLG